MPMTATVDITSINGLFNFLIGLFTAQQWVTILVLLALNFGAAYILKQVYTAIIPAERRSKSVIRLLAVVAGYVAGYTAFRSGYLDHTNWWIAGSLAWTFSIALYHALEMSTRLFIVISKWPGLASVPLIGKLAPAFKFLGEYLEKAYPYLKGYDRRKAKRAS